MRRLLLAGVVGSLMVTGCSSSSGHVSSTDGKPTRTVVVFAAASLKSAFTTLAQKFESAHPGVHIVSSFGGSDTLAAQIVQGAPVDVFASANQTTMATVSKAGDARTPTDFAKNQLEIAVPRGNPRHVASLADLAKPGVKLALCATAVPCGSAAAKALQAGHVAAHPVTLEQDVTSVLTKVELGEVDAGIVYQTDVNTAGGKVEGITFPEASQATNTYPIAVVSTGKNPAGGSDFVQFVLSPTGQQVLTSVGFESATAP